MYKAIIVDDEEMIRKGIKNVIPWELLGIDEVQIASSAKEAFEKMKNIKFNIMITDICMPEIDGLALVQEVNNINPELKIIVLTGFDNFEYAQKCCKMKVNDFLLKPVDEEELSKVIEKLVKDLDYEKDKVVKQKKMVRVEGTAEQVKLERLMQNIIYDINSEEAIFNIKEEYKLKNYYKFKVVILTHILDDNLSWKNHYKLLNLSVKKACIEVIDCNNKGITFEDRDRNIIILMFVTDDSKCDEDLRFLVRYLKEEYSINQKIVLGSSVNDISKANISYNDGIMLINKSRSNINSVNDLYSEEEIKRYNESLYYVKKSISENINNLDNLISIYDKFSKHVDSYNLSIYLIRKSCFDIAITVYFSYINEFDNMQDDKINSLAVSLHGTNKENTIKITRDFIIQLYGIDDKENKDIIIKAKKYIKDNLDKSISVYSIAEMLYVNPTYFSRLFKNSTGEGCNNYIVRKKIEKAKYLFKTTSMRTGKVAEIVGYKDPNYFSLTFKKQTGFTPKEFREMNGESYERKN